VEVLELQTNFREPRTESWVIKKIWKSFSPQGLLVSVSVRRLLPLVGRAGRHLPCGAARQGLNPGREPTSCHFPPRSDSPHLELRDTPSAKVRAVRESFKLATCRIRVVSGHRETLNWTNKELCFSRQYFYGAIGSIHVTSSITFLPSPIFQLCNFTLRF
jgi:hypothetical protein